uniref:Transaldolase n=1 Tax=Thermorudis peleae TaxID=1382356 RepID=A0A831X2G0_9BACT
MSNPLKQLGAYGQSFWLDFLSRPMITSSELARLIEDDGLRGVTSNPTIFDKAIGSTDEYDEEIVELAARGLSSEAIFEALAVHDVQKACDLLRLVYEAADGQDGFVSLELPPDLAYDTEGSIREARRLFALIDRPNAMIKVPGTPQGIPAIEQLIADGVNVNITLLFSIQNYEQVMESYLRGVERRAERGLAVDRIASVASFFVSRVDTEVDRRLDELIAQTESPERRARLEALKGKVAIANAKIAYQRFKRVFLEGERFKRLQERHGARIQRPLWASTSTKNPAYSDVMYVEHLIGPYTVQTMAPVTVEAYRDHGQPRPNTVEEGVEEAEQTLAALAEVGINYDEVTELLQRQGVDLFAESYRSLMRRIDEKRRQLAVAIEGRASQLGPFDRDVRATAERLVRQRVIERLWAREPSIWSQDPTVQRAIAERLGWLAVHETMLERVGELEALTEEVRQAGFRQAVLLGMGGSSLAPEVFQRVFGNEARSPELIVLDTTNPDTIARLERELDLDRTLFIVSSKSGTTIETTSLYRYWYSRLAERKGEAAARHFIAITDPDTPLAREAQERGFRRIFLNPPDIGGRYSALSYFGLVPAAVIGLPVRALLEPAREMAERLRAERIDNPGLWLGVALARLAEAGRDKVTFITEPALTSLGDWLEQLLAESTGKQETGLVPIVGEPHLAPEGYGADRVFVGIDLALQPHPQTEALLGALAAAGHPVLRSRLWNTWELGAEFLRWEAATAIAGALLGINPFDEPNVQESKDRTGRLLDGFAKTRELTTPPATAANELVLASGIPAASVPEAIERFLDEVRLGGYLALLAFADPMPEVDSRLREARRLLLERLGVATTLGYGPRYLHSIGQLYKGGPPGGAFLLIVVEPRGDLPIPEAPYTFRTLFLAQAFGDYQALADRGKPVLLLRITGDPAHGLDWLLQHLVTAAAR